MDISLDLNPNNFPLEDIPSVIKLFKLELQKNDPNLALLSIIAGAVENTLTCVNFDSSVNENDILEDTKIPSIHYETVINLYSKFHKIITGSVDLNYYDKKRATRELIKRVSDIIWNTLMRSYYKDRAHLQSVYSYLTGNKLDCFGVAFTVVAACQLLGYSDVHLALSEDHAWVVFGENLSNTAEVTWHGKGNEDKRGQSIEMGINARSWLYVNGFPIICNRYMEVTALVSSINPSYSLNGESIEVATLQQQLLWILYDKGHLNKYPMAIGNLAELEELNPTPGRISLTLLFQQAIVSARKHYNNMHVYPYTYQAGYYYRLKLYKQAFKAWANASDVIKQYNYSRDDEEIYKEVMEIANELIPHIMRTEGNHSGSTILKDPECFADLLRFYDGICLWEEGSQTPILHITWAKPFRNTISKFDPEVRSSVDILDHDLQDDQEVTNNNDCCKPRMELSCLDLIHDIETKIDASDENLNPKIKALSAACGEKILNPLFLLKGGGEPFVDECKPGPSTVEFNVDRKSRPKLVLHSQKMRGLKNLLLAEKLNAQAISLQLTAQSQVYLGSKKRVLDESTTSRPKRSRRD